MTNRARVVVPFRSVWRWGGALSTWALITSVTHAGGGLTFTDVTAASGVIARHDPSGALLFAPSIIADLIGPVVVGDFNNDGWQDIFFVSSGKQPDRLFINNGDGTFTDRAAEWGVAVKHMGLSACVGDYDGDGWLDIFVTSGGLDGSPLAKGKHRLYRNLNGSGFEEVAQAAGVATASPFIADGLGCAFGDFDLDGDLDLFVAGYFIVGKGNRLFRNNGNGTFTDVSAPAGFQPLPIHGFSPRFVDMDGDRYPELLIAADFHTSKYFVNNMNGTFTNATLSSGTGTDDNGMGSVVADLDGDGRFDWFVTSIWAVGSPETPGTGNRLYRNMGNHAYLDVTVASGVLNGNWAWGATAVDLNHNGSLDLVQANGWITSPQFQNQPTRVWINDGTGGFTEQAAATGLWHTLSGRGVLSFDFDNDGDRDVLIAASKDFLKLYRNDLIAPGGSMAGRHWLRVEIDSRGSPRVAPFGIGTRIELLASGRRQFRFIDGGTNFQSQDELAAHFGLGSAEVVDELRLLWSDGTTTLLRDVAADQRLTIAIKRRCDLDRDDRVNGADLAILLGHWGEIDDTDPIDLNADGAVNGADLLLLLANWGW
ncbi:MAG: VCBS repeat-containing protein [Phycisphaeraceae bacterium]|nr:VCBS repeat-containing protein [Phycisphaeraceae bacterium]